MSDRLSATEATIARLGTELRPVRRLAPPWRRAALWLGASVWLLGLLAIFADFSAVGTRLSAAADMWLATASCVLTAILAAVGAHLTSIPGRSPRWAALPLPALLVWIGASAAGCLRAGPLPATSPESPMHPMLCFYFIVLAAAPLAALLWVQVRRAYPLRPRLTATLVGLASAAAAAALLTLIHPFDANGQDLATHFVAVALIVLVLRRLSDKEVGGAVPAPPIPPSVT